MIIIFLEIYDISCDMCDYTFTIFTFIKGLIIKSSL